jgi:hypothetical protein
MTVIRKRLLYLSRYSKIYHLLCCLISLPTDFLSDVPQRLMPVLGYSSWLGGSSDENNAAGHRGDIATAQYGAYITDPRQYPSSITFSSGSGFYGQNNNGFFLKVDQIPNRQKIVIAAGNYDGTSTNMGIQADLAEGLATAINTDLNLSAEFAINGTDQAGLTDCDTAASPCVKVDINTSNNTLSLTSVNSSRQNLSPEAIEITHVDRHTRENFGLSIKQGGSISVYVTGHSLSADFPSTSGAFDTSANGQYDVFVSKIIHDADGTRLDYTSFIGGTGDDFAHAIATDNQGNAYITGQTSSTNFPVGTQENEDRLHNTANPQGGIDAFALKLSADGNSLKWSTYIGGTNTDVGTAITAHHEEGIYGNTSDNVDIVHIAGYTLSDASNSDFGQHSEYQPLLAGNRDAFLAKLTFTHDGNGNIIAGHYNASALPLTFPSIFYTGASNQDTDDMQFDITVGASPTVTIGLIPDATYNDGNTLAGTLGTLINNALVIGGGSDHKITATFGSNRFTFTPQITVTDAVTISNTETLSSSMLGIDNGSAVPYLGNALSQTFPAVLSRDANLRDTASMGFDIALDGGAAVTVAAVPDTTYATAAALATALDTNIDAAVTPKSVTTTYDGGGNRLIITTNSPSFPNINTVDISNAGTNATATLGLANGPGNPETVLPDSKGHYKGQLLGLSFPTVLNNGDGDTLDVQNMQFDISDDLGASATVTLTANSYATGQDLADQIEAAIEAVLAGSDVEVSYDTPQHRFMIDTQASSQVAVNRITISNAEVGAIQQLGLRNGDGIIEGLNIPYATFLGGQFDEIAHAMVHYSDGHIAISGESDSGNLPIKLAGQSVLGGQTDAFISKLLPDILRAGSAQNTLIWSTFLGGRGTDTVYGMALQPNTSTPTLWLTGFSHSDAFPGLSEGLSISGHSDAFVSQLIFNPDLNQTELIDSRLIGGSASDTGYDIAVTPNNTAYLIGGTHSEDLATLNPLQKDLNNDGDYDDSSEYDLSTSQGEGDAFIAAVTSDDLLSLSYLGGEGLDIGHAIALDTRGQQYLTGVTTSTQYPNIYPIKDNNTTYDFSVPAGNADAFISQVTDFDRPRIRISPATIYSANGDTFLAQIIVDSGTQAIQSAQIRLTFDPTKVRLIGGSLSGDKFDRTLPQHLDTAAINDNGEIQILATMEDGRSVRAVEQPNGLLVLYTLEFRTIATSGNSSLTLDSAYTFVTDTKNKRLDVDLDAALIALHDKLLQLSVTQQGRPNAPQASLVSTLSVNVPDSANCSTTCLVQTDNTGTFVLGLNGSGTPGADVTDGGSHLVRIKGAHTLQIKTQINFDNDLVKTTLRSPLPEGDTTDINDTAHDSYNKVDLFDFSYFVSRLGSRDAQADFNQDNIVDLADFSLLSSNFGRTGRTKAGVLPVAATLQFTNSENQHIVMKATFHEPTDSVLIHLNFDPKKVQIAQLKPRPNLDAIIHQHYDNQNGEIILSAGVLQHNPLTGTQDILDIILQTPVDQNNPIHIDTEVSKTFQAGISRPINTSTKQSNIVTLKQSPYTSGGCSIGRHNTLDPTLWLMWLIWLIFRKRNQLLRGNDRKNARLYIPTPR